MFLFITISFIVDPMLYLSLFDNRKKDILTLPSIQDLDYMMSSKARHIPTAEEIDFMIDWAGEKKMCLLQDEEKEDDEEKKKEHRRRAAVQRYLEKRKRKTWKRIFFQSRSDRLKNRHRNAKGNSLIKCK
jgi:hypothetical protein